MLFGGFVGLLMGALSGTVCCALLDFRDFLGQWAVIGAAMGVPGGALIALVERKLRGEQVRPDIATVICVVYALLPALIILLGGLGIVRGKLSGFLLLGAVFACPMCGLLIGGVLDRAYEAGRNRIGVAVGAGAAGMAFCLGLLYLVATLTARPDPDQVAQEARTMILQEWKGRKIRDAVIRTITLDYEGNRVYTGFVEATIEGSEERFRLWVVHDREIVDLSLNPMEE
jgi:hypothetical protein